jgi:c(7)-type cytochrome triheme protein
MPKLEVPRFTFWRGVLLVILALGTYATVVRVFQGLAGSTNLTDSFPWGLWIGFDILCGVALAAGGFTISATVYIFNLEKFRPIVRPAILTAFLGYVLVVVALMFDLGRPWNIWHPLVMWNPHSVMFEVGWCVTLYTTVLALEFSPLVLERFKMTKTLHVLHAVMPVLVVLGVLLSTLHQSSLGSFYLIVPTKLHALWYSPLIPLYFFLTALTLGCAMTIVESFLSHRAFGKHLEMELLVPLGRVALLLLGLTAIIRFADFRHRGILGLAFQPTYESRLFLAEMLVGVLAPAVLLALPKVRRHPTGLFLAALLVVMGVVMNRLNVSITGMERSSGQIYVPALTEVFITLSVVGVGFLVFALAVNFLPVFPEHEMKEARPIVVPAGGNVAGQPIRSLPFPALVIVALAFFGAVALGADGVRRREVAPGPPAPAGKPPLAAALASFQPPKEVVFPRAPDSPGPVTFRHAAHVDAAAPDCTSCHGDGAVSFLGRTSAPPAGQMHDAKHCGGCHDGTSAFAIDADCSPCHKAE